MAKKDKSIDYIWEAVVMLKTGELEKMTWPNGDLMLFENMVEGGRYCSLLAECFPDVIADATVMMREKGAY